MPWPLYKLWRRFRESIAPQKLPVTAYRLRFTNHRLTNDCLLQGSASLSISNSERPGSRCILVSVVTGFLHCNTVCVTMQKRSYRRMKSFSGVISLSGKLCALFSLFCCAVFSKICCESCYEPQKGVLASYIPFRVYSFTIREYYTRYDIVLDKTALTIPDRVL